MKSLLIPVLLLMAAFQQTPLGAREDRHVPYEPDVVTLGGTVVRESFGEDASPVDRGKHALILRLDQRISVPAKPGDDIDTAEWNVTEVHLNIDPEKYRIPKGAFGRTHFIVTGTLYHSHTIHHRRPIVMLVSDITPVASKAGRN